MTTSAHDLGSAWFEAEATLLQVGAHLDALWLDEQGWWRAVSSIENLGGAAREPAKALRALAAAVRSHSKDDS